MSQIHSNRFYEDPDGAPERENYPGWGIEFTFREAYNEGKKYQILQGSGLQERRISQ